MVVSLADALAARDNDYLDLVAEFCDRTELGWHEPTPPTAAAGTRLSVVIPAHNNAYSLVPVLDALTVQETSGTVQIIVVDDASTDDTPAIIAKHPAVDIGYRISQQVGAGAARNVGTHLAQANTVVYVDADMVLTGHVLADIGARAHPALVLVGFRHNVRFRDASCARMAIPVDEPDLADDHRVCWPAPVGVPTFYSGQVYEQPFTGHPLDHTHEFLDLGNGAIYHDWDLPRMVITSLVAVPRAAVIDVGGFDACFDADGWGAEDIHLGAALIAAGCKVVPLRQARGFHLDPPDAKAQWEVKFATAARRVARYRRLLTQPAPSGRAGELTARAGELIARADRLR